MESCTTVEQISEFLDNDDNFDKLFPANDRCHCLGRCVALHLYMRASRLPFEEQIAALQRLQQLAPTLPDDIVGLETWMSKHPEEKEILREELKTVVWPGSYADIDDLMTVRASVGLPLK